MINEYSDVTNSRSPMSIETGPRKRERLDPDSNSSPSLSKKKILEQKLLLAEDVIREQQEEIRRLSDENSSLKSKGLMILQPENDLLKQDTVLKDLLGECVSFHFPLKERDVAHFILPESFVKALLKTYEGPLEQGKFREASDRSFTLEKSYRLEAINHLMLTCFQGGLVSLSRKKTLKEMDEERVLEMLPDLLELADYTGCEEIFRECRDFLCSQFEKGPDYLFEYMNLCLSAYPKYQFLWMHYFRKMNEKAGKLEYKLDVASKLAEGVNSIFQPLSINANAILSSYFRDCLDLFTQDIKEPFVSDLYLAFKKLNSFIVGKGIILRLDELFKKENSTSPAAMIVDIYSSLYDDQIEVAFSKLEKASQELDYYPEEFQEDILF